MYLQVYSLSYYYTCTVHLLSTLKELLLFYPDIILFHTGYFSNDVTNPNWLIEIHSNISFVTRMKCTINVRNTNLKKTRAHFSEI